MRYRWVMNINSKVITDLQDIASDLRESMLGELDFREAAWLGLGKTMWTGGKTVGKPWENHGKTMVKKTGTPLEAMGRCRKLFSMGLWEVTHRLLPWRGSVVGTSKDVEKLGKACWKLSSKMEDSRNRMGYKPNIIQPFCQDTVRIQRDDQSYAWYAVVQKGLHSKLWQFYCRTIRKKKIIPLA